MEPFYNDDIATEVLSRLPTNSLMAFKFVSKRWNKFISDPSFLRIHCERSYDIVGFFVQYRNKCAESPNFISFINKEKMVESTALDFLPNKGGEVVASSNGLLCLRSCITKQVRVVDPLIFNATSGIVVYICDPTRKEWLAIRCETGCSNPIFGFASYPFGTFSNPTPSFKLVSIQRMKYQLNQYSFAIYSSETQRWKLSDAVCIVDSEIHQTRVIFANKRLHWLTLNHHMVIFDVEKELSTVIKLPGITPYHAEKCEMGICFGESEGYFHYVCAFLRELHVWVLKDYSEPTWELKHCVPVSQFYEDNSSLLCAEGVLDRIIKWPSLFPDNLLNSCLEPLAYKNEVLSMRLCDLWLSYNFRSKTLIKHCSTKFSILNYYSSLITVPCHVNLISLSNFAQTGINSNLKQGRREVTSLTNDRVTETPGDEDDVRPSRLRKNRRLDDYEYS